MSDAAITIAGFLELRTSYEVKGWAHDPAASGKTIHVEILHNGKVIGIVLADQFRADLKRKGLGNHGFHFVSDSALANPNGISAKILETGHALQPLRTVSSLIKPRKLPSRYGDIWTTSSDDLISRALEKYGEWGLAEVELVIKLAGGSKHLWDIGAYLGTFSLGFRGIEKVVSVEANTTIIPLLVENIGLAKDSRLSFVLNAAVGNVSNEPASVYTQDQKNVGASIVSNDPARGGPKVSWIRLSEMGELFGIPDLVKLDVEGQEAACIRESEDWLKRHMPELWIECNESLDSIRLFEVLNKIGYKIYYFSIPAWNCSNFGGIGEDIFGGIHEAGFFCSTRHFSGEEIERLAAWRGISRPIFSADELRLALWSTPRQWRKELVARKPFELLALIDRCNQDSFSEFLK